MEPPRFEFESTGTHPLKADYLLPPGKNVHFVHSLFASSGALPELNFQVLVQKITESVLYLQYMFYCTCIYVKAVKDYKDI